MRPARPPFLYAQRFIGGQMRLPAVSFLRALFLPSKTPREEDLRCLYDPGSAAAHF